MNNDLNNVIEAHKKLLDSLNSTLNLSEKFKDNINKSIYNLLKEKTLSVLKNIDVSALSGKGFRIKLLQENGYNDAASLYNASLNELANIKGISAEGARNINMAVTNLFDETMNNQTISIRSDGDNVDVLNLLKNIYIYLYTKDIISECNDVYNRNKDDIDDALASIKKTNGFFGLFQSASVKQDSENAKNNLINSYNSGFYKVALDKLNTLKAICDVDDSSVYSDYNKNSIKYINVINEINPNALEKENGNYDLPKELAIEVDKQSYYKDQLKCTLRKYQEYGVKFILHQKRVLLGDEMGLGKTIQAIGVMASLLECDQNHFLVICPASVLVNWCKEIKEKSTLNTYGLHGDSKKEDFQKWLDNGGVAVCTYEGSGDFTFPENFKLPLLIVDEAHYIKNKNTLRSKNVSKLCNISNRILFMTGTALENNLSEMISLLYMLRPDIAARVERLSIIGTTDKFKQLVAPVYFRRKREDVLGELPEKIESKQWCTLLDDEKLAYHKALLSHNYALIRRVSFNIDDMSKSSKAIRLKEIVEMAKEDNRKVIVFSFFLDTISKVSKLFESQSMEPITGSLSPEERQSIIDKFNDAPSGTILPAQIQSGGTGLNIQTASVVVICEPQFKPSIENQAISRCYRMGQSRSVLVYRLLCEHTIDEKIVDVLKQKQKIFDEYADKSESGEESINLNDKNFNDLIEEEIKNIKIE